MSESILDSFDKLRTSNMQKSSKYDKGTGGTVTPDNGKTPFNNSTPSNREKQPVKDDKNKDKKPVNGESKTEETKDKKPVKKSEETTNMAEKTPLEELKDAGKETAVKSEDVTESQATASEAPASQAPASQAPAESAAPSAASQAGEEAVSVAPKEGVAADDVKLVKSTELEDMFGTIAKSYVATKKSLEANQVASDAKMDAVIKSINDLTEAITKSTKATGEAVEKSLAVNEMTADAKGDKAVAYAAKNINVAEMNADEIAPVESVEKSANVEDKVAKSLDAETWKDLSHRFTQRLIRERRTGALDMGQAQLLQKNYDAGLYGNAEEFDQRAFVNYAEGK